MHCQQGEQLILNLKPKAQHSQAQSVPVLLLVGSDTWVVSAGCCQAAEWLSKVLKDDTDRGNVSDACNCRRPKQKFWSHFIKKVVLLSYKIYGIPNTISTHEHMLTYPANIKMCVDN